MVEIFIENGANINATDSDGDTALIRTAFQGKILNCLTKLYLHTERISRVNKISMLQETPKC